MENKDVKKNAEIEIFASVEISIARSDRGSDEFLNDLIIGAETLKNKTVVGYGSKTIENSTQGLITIKEGIVLKPTLSKVFTRTIPIKPIHQADGRKIDMLTLNYCDDIKITAAQFQFKVCVDIIDDRGENKIRSRRLKELFPMLGSDKIQDREM